MALITLAFLAVAQILAPPIVVPFEVVENELAIRVQIDGKERRVLLSVFAEQSYVRGKTPIESELKIGGQSFGKVLFIPESEQQATYGEDGGLGMPLLRKMAVGVDVVKRQVTFWPNGDLAPKVAEDWVDRLSPIPGSSKPRRLRADQVPIGALSLNADIAGKAVPLLVRFGYYGTFLEPSVKRPDIPLPVGSALLPPLSVAGLPPTWFWYKPASESLLRRDRFGVEGAISTDVFGSRRVLLDFAGKAVYVQEVSPEVRQAEFLKRFVRLPLGIRKEGIFIEFLGGEGRDREPKLIPYEGSQILSMAEERAGDWWTDLQGTDENAARSFAARLAKLFTGFSVQVLTPAGNEAKLNIKDQSAPR